MSVAKRVPNEIVIDMSSTKVVSVKLNAEVVHELDKLCKDLNFSNRSELIREALSLYLSLVKRLGKEGIRKFLDSGPVGGSG